MDGTSSEAELAVVEANKELRDKMKLQHAKMAVATSALDIQILSSGPEQRLSAPPRGP